ncbi:MAG TPA: hypothetical protein VLT62_06830 [Candidatus Methylomirabilis sp.]|nr:hypothetical protein [Candidatus Methylomirabilis sp.]
MSGVSELPSDDPWVKARDSGSGLTAYPGDEAALRRRLAGGRVDAGSFCRPVARCDIAACRGMCCYDGVYVSPESAAVIARLAVERADFFAGLGLQLPPRVIVEGGWVWKTGGLKTAVSPRAFSAAVRGYPSHFNDTACVFLTGDGLCSLQLLSQHQGRHPWYYKPVKCWMHPITLKGDEEGTLILHDERTDPYRFPGYAGFVSQIFCGRTCQGGKPASAVLVDELGFLSRIVGRDLLAEAGGKSGPVIGPDGSGKM